MPNEKSPSIAGNTKTRSERFRQGRPGLMPARPHSRRYRPKRRQEGARRPTTVNRNWVAETNRKVSDDGGGCPKCRPRPRCANSRARTISPPTWAAGSNWFTDSPIQRKTYMDAHSLFRHPGADQAAPSRARQGAGWRNDRRRWRRFPSRSPATPTMISPKRNERSSQAREGPARRPEGRVRSAAFIMPASAGAAQIAVVAEPADGVGEGLVGRSRPVAQLALRLGRGDRTSSYGPCARNPRIREALPTADQPRPGLGQHGDRHERRQGESGHAAAGHPS